MPKSNNRKLTIRFSDLHTSLLCEVSDNGIGTCLDAKSGAVNWQKRLGGNHSASPLHADGRIYFQSEEGESLIVAPGKEYLELARNTIDERTLASLAVSGKAIYLRGERSLYRIEKALLKNA